VNLGGWLVLEKWMTPSLFKGMAADDEYTFCAAATADQLERLDRHRDTFITKADFVWLKQQGVQAVRLPIGYWAFGGAAPYQPTIEYADRAFAWAEEVGLKVLLDLHGAPGSQNGRDHSGRIGPKDWYADEKNMQETINILERLVRRYKASPSFLGIELLNEPGWSPLYPTLRRYYQQAAAMVRRECGPAVWIVYSDFFTPLLWRLQTQRRPDHNLVIDTHHYQAFGRRDKRLSLAGHIRKIVHKVPRKFRRVQVRRPLIVGEWSLVLPGTALEGLNELQQEAVRRMYGAAQIAAYERTRAWFYWSYKTEDGGVWSFRDCIEKGWLPKLTKG
ncbi:MAG TPA: glycoside hydrolase family 5 protein, partial [Candidatus Saccharimonadales bacterium]|nr:glycoside hydrolase family 5 protein [Candidatus Saccharimonadales bacterium]